MTPLLSALLPIRCSSEDDYRVERLARCLAFLERYDRVESVVVDSGSAPGPAARIRGLCERRRCQLVLDPEPQSPFAPGATRNAGARWARGEYLLTFDVDLVCDEGLVPALLRWAAAPRAADEFLVTPCLFLTAEATERIGVAGVPVDLRPLRAALLAGDTTQVSHFAATHTLVSRRHFLRIGGYRPEFRGHGCEDFDLLHRLFSYRPIGARPADYYLDHKTRLPGDYRGFRAYFAAAALPLLFDGTFTAHLWHPRPLLRPYFRRRHDNERLLQEWMRRHDAGEAATNVLHSLVEGQGVDSPALGVPWAAEGTTPLAPIGERIESLAIAAGHDRQEAARLLRDGGQPPLPRRGTAVTRLRKLVLRPRRFLRDSRLPALRALGRLFPHEP